MGLKLVMGNPGRRPLGNEPSPKGEIPACPADLSKEAKTEWRRITKELLAVNVISKLDRAALAAYCQSYARWMEAERKIADTGLVIKTQNGNLVENPFYSISKRERELMHKFLGEFGLSPVARCRIDMAAAGDPASVDPAERYFGNKQA